MPEPTSHRLMAVLAADAAGYSRLMAADDLATVAALDAARAIFRGAVVAAQGRVVDTAGDSVLAAFPSTQGAVAAALQVQNELRSAASALTFRIGVHLGDVIEKADGSIYGDGVNVAARLQALAAPGGVVVSQEVLAVVGTRLSVPATDLGLQAVKNIARPVHAHALGEQAVAAAAHGPTRAAAVTSALPNPRTRFVGRERERAEASALLQQGALLTLTGIGGSGKTRLAIEVARDRMGEAGAGGAAWFVDLAQVADAADLPRAVADVLGLRDLPGPGAQEAQRTLAGYLAVRMQGQRALLVLDNCEHLVDAVADLVETLLDACAELAVLATSREPLGVPGEVVRPLRSLALAAASDLDALRHCEAVRLFVDRGRLAAPAFDVDAGNAAAVHEICQRLDGIPLALELAAARLNLLSVEQICARLGDRFRLLAGGRRALPLHQTLAAVIRWSHDHLGANEQRLLGRLSVFSGGCTLAAAAAVAGAPEADVVDALSGLVSKSLVVVATEGVEARYTMLETVRQYALERLEEAGEAEPARDAHLAFFAALAGAAPEGVRTAGTVAATGATFAALLAERDNISAALRFGIEARRVDMALPLAGALQEFWKAIGAHGSGHRLTEEVLAVADAAPTPARLRALEVACDLALFAAPYERTLALADECLRVARALRSPLGEVSGLKAVAAGALALQDYPRALQAVEAMEQVVASLDPSHRRSAEHMKAEVLRGQGRLDEAEDVYRAHLEEARVAGRPDRVFSTCINLALVALARGDLAAGRTQMRDGAAAHPASMLGLDGTAHLMAIVAALMACSGEPAAAARLHGAALAHAQRLGIRLEPVDEVPILRWLHEARVALGDEAFDEALAEGRRGEFEPMFARAVQWLAQDESASSRPRA